MACSLATCMVFVSKQTAVSISPVPLMEGGGFKKVGEILPVNTKWWEGGKSQVDVREI